MDDELHEVEPDAQPTLEELIDFYDPAYRETIRKAFKDCHDEGKPFDIEAQFVTGKGRPIWVRAIGEAVRSPKGGIARVQGTIQDITERKKAEKSLERSEIRFRQLAESIPMIVWTASPDGNVGVTETVLGGKRENLLRRVVWEDGKIGREGPFAVQFRRALSENLVVQFDAWYDPAKMWLEVRVYPFDEGLSVYFRDVTQLRREADTLKIRDAALEAPADSIAITDVKGIVIWVNTAYAKSYGYKKVLDFLAKPFTAETLIKAVAKALGKEMDN